MNELEYLSDLELDYLREIIVKDIPDWVLNELATNLNKN